MIGSQTRHCNVQKKHNVHMNDKQRKASILRKRKREETSRDHSLFEHYVKPTIPWDAPFHKHRIPEGFDITQCTDCPLIFGWIHRLEPCTKHCSLGVALLEEKNTNRESGDSLAIKSSSCPTPPISDRGASYCQCKTTASCQGHISFCFKTFHHTKTCRATLSQHWKNSKEFAACVC